MKKKSREFSRNETLAGDWHKGRRAQKPNQEDQKGPKFTDRAPTKLLVFQHFRTYWTPIHHYSRRLKPVKKEQLSLGWEIKAQRLKSRRTRSIVAMGKLPRTTGNFPGLTEGTKGKDKVERGSQ